MSLYTLVVIDPLNGVSATDDVDGVLPATYDGNALPGTLSYTSSDPAFDRDNPAAGIYTFSYTATDTTGNSATLTDSRVLTVHATTVTGTNRVVDASNQYINAFNGRWDTSDNSNNGCALISAQDTTQITLDSNTVNSHYGYIYKSHVVPVNFNSVVLHTRGQGFDPVSFTFIGSNDGTTWSTLFNGTKASHTIIYDPDLDPDSDPAHDPVNNVLYDPTYSLWTNFQSVGSVSYKHVGILITSPSTQTHTSIVEVRFETN